MIIYRLLYLVLCLTWASMLLDMFGVADLFRGIPSYSHHRIIYILIGIAAAKFLQYGYMFIRCGKVSFQEAYIGLYFGIFLESLSLILIGIGGRIYGENLLIFGFSTLLLANKILELKDLQEFISKKNKNANNT